MGNALQIQDYISPSDNLEDIRKALEAIQSQLLKELAYKQSLLEAKDLEISGLQAALEVKSNQVEELTQRIQAVERNNEGNKQLNKKLISEIVRKQQDIEWYKRTFEKRSLLGTLKEKLIKKFI
jgi:hypothetical protein